MQASLYAKYGGFSKIHNLIENFYEKILLSENLGVYFLNVDMEPMIKHQTSFVSSLMGGPASFNDEQLKLVHHSLNITQNEWEEVIVILVQVLNDFGVEKADSDSLIRKLEDKKGLFICPQ